MFVLKMIIYFSVLERLCIFKCA